MIRTAAEWDRVVVEVIEDLYAEISPEDVGALLADGPLGPWMRERAIDLIGPRPVEVMPS